METKKETIQEREIKGGTLLFKENEQSREMYVIKSGKVEVFIERLNKEIILGQLERGDVLGEMSLFDNRPRSASARVLEDAVVIVITHDMFDKRLENVPEWLITIIRILIQRLREADKKIGDTVLKDDMFNTTIIMSYILGKGSSHNHRPDLQAIKEELLETFAIEEKIFTRVLDKLKLQGLLKFEHGTLVAIDIVNLKKYVKFLRGILEKDYRIDVEMSDQAYEFITMILWLSKRKGFLRDEKTVTPVDFMQSETEKMMREFIDNKTIDELVGLGLVAVEQDPTSFGRKMNVIFDAGRLEKIIEFKRMIKLFSWNY
jgi:CRP/FNR family transcriptional regulator, cyclic AMP receptor protein